MCLSQPEAVRMTVLGRLISLTHLDDMLVTEEEASAAVQMAAGSRINQVRVRQENHSLFLVHDLPDRLNTLM